MSTNIALPIRRFFEQHLVAERGLSQHTILSYRDTLKLLLGFAAKLLRKHCEELTVEDLSAETVRKFLADLETTRRNGVRTRNARLAGIHAFFRYLATLDPRFLAHCQSVLGVPFKRHIRPVLDYLQREEVTNILSQINRDTRYGRRDDAILRLLYNTGARAQEIVNIDVPDIRFSRPYLVRLHGKGHKERTCPLWAGNHDSDQDLSAGAIDETDGSHAPLCESQRRQDYSFWIAIHHWSSGNFCRQGQSRPAHEKDRTSYLATHDLNAFAAVGRGLEHDPILVGTFKHRNDSRIC